ncbi:PAS domain-containing protein [Roseomonas sp. CCTCC AB2023176]|uniref:PAS domain-containing protein n=1 Tax=Roseomonas sp. CCTCC AB2023176 TaxID=3342640 RepID=UPI0035D5DDCF
MRADPALARDAPDAAGHGPADPPRPVQGPRGPRGIRARLVLLVLATLLPVLLFTGLLAWRFAAGERGAVERDILQRATALAREVDSEVDSVAAALRAVAASAEFRDADLPRLHAQLGAVSRLLGGPIAYRDTDGRLLLHSALPLDAPLPPTPLDAAFRAIPADTAVYVGDLATNPVGGQPVWGIVLPASDAAGRRRFLAIGLHPRALLPVLRRATPGPGWTTAVLDRNNRIVIRSARPDETIGQFVAGVRESAGLVWRTVNPDAVPVVAAGAALASGWTVAVSLPAATVDAPLRRAAYSLAAIGLATFAAAAGAALVVGGRIARSIGSLAAGAAALGAGRPMPPIRTDLREVAEVAEALSDAAATATARSAALADREAALARTQRLARVGGFEIEVTHGPDGPRFQNFRSPEYLLLHGLTPEAVEEPHLAWERRIHREDRDRVAAEFARAIAGREATYAQEYRIVTPAGELRSISARAEIERDEQGRARHIRGVHLDVTELRRAEARLRENEMALAAAEERLRLALEAGDLVAWEVDTASGIGTASSGHFRLLGLPMPPDGHSLLRDWEKVVLPEDRPVQDAARRRAMEGDGTYHAEIRIRRPVDGAIRWISSVGRRVPGTRRVIGVYADATERKAAEETLRARVRDAVAAAEAAQAPSPRPGNWKRWATLPVASRTTSTTSSRSSPPASRCCASARESPATRAPQGCSTGLPARRSAAPPSSRACSPSRAGRNCGWRWSMPPRSSPRSARWW